IDDLGTLAGMLTAAELREACKPLLLAHLLARAPGQSVLYLDADSLVCGPLEDIELLAADHGVLVKTRTARSLPQDGRRPNEADLRGWGLHDDGLIALGAGHDHRALLDWGAARGRAGSGPHGGSLPIERIATLGRGAYEIGDDGLGASFWDLHGRTIVAHEHGTLIDGSPLRLMRFPGFDPHHPLALSDAQSRLRAAEQPALAALCERYAGLLLDAGEAEASQLPYAFERLPDGTRFDHRLRTIYREAVEQAGLRRSPFTRWGMEEFYAWLGEAYPDLDHDTEAYGLIEWLHRHGVREGTLPAAVVPPTSPDEREAERRRRARTTNFGVNVAGYFTAA